MKKLTLIISLLYFSNSHAQTFETNDPKTLFDDIVTIDSVKCHVMSYTNTPHYDLYRITDEINVFELFIWSDGRKYSLLKIEE